ncbi:MAG: CHAT domain-containing tetratricopeptide repeat protein [Cytophagales bacterium]|nr:CHAT domain-containing tetratricopeptide repeat protein [Cytophagales bacterium]
MKGKFSTNLFFKVFFLLVVCSVQAQDIDFQASTTAIDDLIAQQDYEQAYGELKGFQSAISGTAYQEEDSVRLYLFSKLSQVYYQLDSCTQAIENNRGEAELRMNLFGPSEITTLQTIRNLGVYYLNCGEYIQADSTLSQVVDLHQKNIGKIDELYVRTLDDLAFAKGRVDQPDEAIEIYAKILEILSNSPKGGFYYQVVENYSALLMNNERFEDAVPFYPELKEYMKDRAEYVDFLKDYYNVFVHLKDYAKAYETSSSIVEWCAIGHCLPEVHLNFNLNAARLAVLMGKYTEADQYYSECQEAEGSTTNDEIQVLLEQADVNGYLGKPFEQVGGLEKCLDLHVRNGLTDSTSYSRVVLRLGNLLTQLGRFEKAETLFTNYIDALERDASADSEKLAQAYQSLGNQKYLLRDFNGADLYLNKARQTLLDHSLEQSRAYASVLNSLGALQEGLANYDQAERYYKVGLEAATQEDAGLSLRVALAANLANIMNSFTPENDSIELLLSKAIGWQQSLTGEKHPEYANLLNKRGLHLQETEQFSAAESDYQKALEILGNSVGRSHPEYLSVLSNLGLLYDAQGNDEAALKYMLDAKQLYEQFYADDNPGYVLAVNNLANTYTRLERYDEAAPLFAYLADIVLKEIRESFSYLSENEKKQFVTEKRKFQDNLKRYIVSRFTTDRVDPQMLATWYELELTMKGILLNSTKRVREQIFKSGDENLIALFSEWSLARQEVAKRQSLKSDLSANQKQALDSLTQKIATLEKDIARASGDFENTFAAEKSDFSSVSSALGADECSIEVIRTEINGDNIYTALLALPGAQYPELILLGKGEVLDEKSFAFYKNTIKFKIDNAKPFDIYWKPIHDRIKDLGIKKIYYAPDGVYHKISLATLFNGETKSYLIEDYELVQLTSTKDIARVKQPASGIDTSKKILLMGRPTYTFSGENSGSIAGTRGLASFENIADLPGTEAEVTEINATLGEKQLQPTLLLGEESTEANFKANLDHDIIHIATHGFFIDKRPGLGEYLDPMLYSGLLLAGASEESTMANTGEDGVLTAYEIMNMEFSNLDMIVLSACETGTGQVASGEGVYGLQRAFFVAGANTLIMSLWKVDDNATKELMIAFYRNYLKTGDKRASFLDAQKKVKKKYKSPVYWGAFVMVGS